MTDPYRHDAGETERLAAFAQALDPGSIEILKRIGVGAGWRCMEVAAGSGSIAHWLADAGADVVAVDTDTRAFCQRPSAGVEVVEDDITRMPVAPAYDLVHARCLLDIVEEPDTVVDALCAAARPGGTVLLEEFDDVSAAVCSGPGAALHDAVISARRAVWRGLGLEPSQGRGLLALLRVRGLVDRQATGRVLIREGGSPAGESWQRSVVALGSELVKTGIVSEGDLDAYLGVLADPEFCWFSAVVVAAWGRRRTSTEMPKRLEESPSGGRS